MYCLRKWHRIGTWVQALADTDARISIGIGSISDTISELEQPYWWDSFIFTDIDKFSCLIHRVLLRASPPTPTPPRPSSCHTLSHIWPSAQICVWLCVSVFGCLVDPSSPLSCQSSITQGLSSCPDSDKHQTPFHGTLCFFGLHSISSGCPSGSIHDTVPCCENAC